MSSTSHYNVWRNLARLQLCNFIDSQVDRVCVIRRSDRSVQSPTLEVIAQRDATGERGYGGLSMSPVEIALFPFPPHHIQKVL